MNTSKHTVEETHSLVSLVKGLFDLFNASLFGTQACGHSKHIVLGSDNLDETKQECKREGPD